MHIPEEAARKAGLAVRPRPYAMEMGSFYTFNRHELIREIRSFWDTGNFARQLGIDHWHHPGHVRRLGAGVSSPAGRAAAAIAG